MDGSTYSIGISWDDEGNIGLNYTKADINTEGVTLGFASIGVSTFYSFTNLETIDSLEGRSLSAGASVPVYGPVSIGGEIALSENMDEIQGGVFSAGVGLGVDVHFTAGYTEITHKSESFGEFCKSVWDGFLGWLGL